MLQVVNGFVRCGMVAKLPLVIVGALLKNGEDIGCFSLVPGGLVIAFFWHIQSQSGGQVFYSLDKFHVVEFH